MFPDGVPDTLFEARIFPVSFLWFPHNFLTGFLTIRNKPYSHKPYGHNHMTIYGYVWPYENKLASGHNTHPQSSLLGF